MKKRLNEKQRSIKQVNMDLDYFDQLVVDGVMTRQELTDIILRRHVLAMKHVLAYASRNLGRNVKNVS